MLGNVFDHRIEQAPAGAQFIADCRWRLRSLYHKLFKHAVETVPQLTNLVVAVQVGAQIAMARARHCLGDVAARHRVRASMPRAINSANRVPIKIASKVYRPDPRASPR
jgi:hypothetical protein